MRFRAGLGAAILALWCLAAGCGGHSSTTTGTAGSVGEAGSGGVAGSLGGGGAQSSAAGHAGGSHAGAAGSASDAGAAASSPGVLRDFLGDARFPDSFWRPASEGEGATNPALLEQAASVIQAKGWELHSFLVAKNGRLIFERYGFSSGTNPFDPNKIPHQVLPDERHLQFSTTKSVLSALVGIAIAEGKMSDVNIHAADSFADYASLNPTAEKSSITLADLLTMRSGLAFVEGDQTTFMAPDPARAMLSRQLVDLPVGTIWNYSSGGANIVAEMLRVATGKTPLEYANEKLFGPVGIDPPPWDAGLNGTHFGGFGLSLTTREMARIGELFRNSGKWNDQAVVPSTWVDESTTPRCRTEWGGQYGYLWWVPDLPGFFNALGSFGQMIYVSRARGLVIVFTAYMPNDVAKTNLEGLVRDYVVPATL